MFSRATKLIVKSFGPRQFHIGEQNLKHVFIGGAGEISRTLSQLLRNGMKLNVLALYDLAAVNKPLPNRHRIRDYCDNQPLIHNRETEELVEALYHLPIAEGAATLNNSVRSNGMTPKAGNVCSGLRPHARLLDKIGPNDTRTRQRDCAIAPIRKCFPGLTCSPFQEYVNVIAATKTSRRHLSTNNKDKTDNSPHNVSDVKENNCQSSSSSSLNDEGKVTGGLTRKFNNMGRFLNTEMSCRMKMSTNRLLSVALLNNKPQWLREIYGHSGGFFGWFPIRTFVGVSNSLIPTGRDGDCFRERLRMGHFEDNAMICGVVEKRSRIQRMSFEIESILSNLHGQIRSRSMTVSDSYNRGNSSAANEALTISVRDLLSGKTILFASKDCDSKFNIRHKLEKICAWWNRLLKRKDRDDICQKRKKTCEIAGGTCQKRGEICQRRTMDCFEKREQAYGKQTTVLCSGRRSSCGDKDDHDICKTRKEKCQKQSCTQYKDNDSSRAKKDSCKKRQKSKETTCTKTKKDKCKKSAEVQKVCQKEKVIEEKKKKDYSDTKKVEPRKECPPVKRAPGCPEEHDQEEDC